MLLKDIWITGRNNNIITKTNGRNCNSYKDKLQKLSYQFLGKNKKISEK